MDSVIILLAGCTFLIHKFVIWPGNVVSVYFKYTSRSFLCQCRWLKKLLGKSIGKFENFQHLHTLSLLLFSCCMTPSAKLSPSALNLAALLCEVYTPRCFLPWWPLHVLSVLLGLHLRPSGTHLLTAEPRYSEHECNI